MGKVKRKKAAFAQERKPSRRVTEEFTDEEELFEELDDDQEEESLPVGELNDLRESLLSTPETSSSKVQKTVSDNNEEDEPIGLEESLNEIDDHFKNSASKGNKPEENTASELKDKVEGLRVQNLQKMEEAQKKFQQVLVMEKLLRRCFSVLEKVGIQLKDNATESLVFVAMEEMQFRNRLAVGKKQGGNMFPAKIYSEIKSLVREITETDWSM